MPTPPTVTRHRLETVRRDLTVASVESLTPHMLRVTLTGEELRGFNSPAPDDNIKLFLTQPDGTVEKRSYTPRFYDKARNELIVDFVDHPGGPAADWARAAKPGDTLSLGGPRGSKELVGEIPHLLLIGDETALPAIGRWIEETGPETRITAVLMVPGEADEQLFWTDAPLDVRWVHRPLSQAADAAPVLAALEQVDLTPGTYAFIAAEAGVTRAARNALQARGLENAWLRASGYWTMGVAEGSVNEATMATT